MEKKKYYKYMFIIAAIWDLVFGSLFIILSPLIGSLSSIFGMQTPPSLFFYHHFFGLLFIVGIGYYLVSRDIDKNHGIVIIGAIGKFYAFMVFLVYFILGFSNFLSLLPGIGDLIFGILFLEFLINYKKIE